MIKSQADIQPEDALQQERFLRAFEPVRAKLWAYLRSMTRGREEAEDLMSETLLISYERFDTLRAEEALLSFMFSVASHVLRSQRRRRRLQALLLERFRPDAGVTATAPDVSTDVQLVLEALQQLPPRQREALALYEIAGLGMQDICAIQGGTVPAMKSRVARARKKLAALLKVESPGKPQGSAISLEKSLNVNGAAGGSVRLLRTVNKSEQ